MTLIRQIVFSRIVLNNFSSRIYSFRERRVINADGILGNYPFNSCDGRRFFSREENKLCCHDPSTGDGSYRQDFKRAYCCRISRDGYSSCSSTFEMRRYIHWTGRYMYYSLGAFQKCPLPSGKKGIYYCQLPVFHLYCLGTHGGCFDIVGRECINLLSVILSRKGENLLLRLSFVFYLAGHSSSAFHSFCS